MKEFGSSPAPHNQAENGNEKAACPLHFPRAGARAGFHFHSASAGTADCAFTAATEA